MSVVVFGSANADMTVWSSRFPAPGETLTGTAFAGCLGGKGLNQAVAVARLGVTTAFAGRVGADHYGHQLRAGLEAVGVDVLDLATDAVASSGVAIVLLGGDGENRIIVVPGANGAVGDEDLQRLGSRLEDAQMLLMQLEVPMVAVVKAIGLAEDHGVPVMLDPAPVPPGGLPAAAYSAHVLLTPNEGEAAALVGFELTDEARVVRAAQVLLARGAGAVVIKLGARGLYWSDGSESGRASARDVEVVDTVGAGDAVNGALAAALSCGATLGEAARQAATAGGLAVTRTGSYNAMPTHQELLVALRDS